MPTPIEEQVASYERIFLRYHDLQVDLGLARAEKKAQGRALAVRLSAESPSGRIEFKGIRYTSHRDRGGVDRDRLAVRAKKAEGGDS